MYPLELSPPLIYTKSISVYPELTHPLAAVLEIVSDEAYEFTMNEVCTQLGPLATTKLKAKKSHQIKKTFNIAKEQNTTSKQ